VFQFCLKKCGVNKERGILITYLKRSHSVQANAGGPLLTENIPRREDKTWKSGRKLNRR
jgi:hypothetical protein